MNRLLRNNAFRLIAAFVLLMAVTVTYIIFISRGAFPSMLDNREIHAVYTTREGE